MGSIGPGGKNQSPEQEPQFVRACRAQIMRFTGQDIGPDDPIYPILVCMQLMTRAISSENRKADADEWRKIAESLRESGGKVKSKMLVAAGIGGLGGLGIGIIVGLALK